MKYCKQCDVYFRGGQERCILCSNSLVETDTAIKQEDVFPDIPPSFTNKQLLRAIIFISVAIIVSSFSIRLIFPSEVNWPLLVLFGVISVWLSLIAVFRKKHDISKTIVWQVTVVAGLSIFWDWQIGWQGWSLNYVLPSLFLLAFLVMFIAAKILNLSLRDYIFYALISSLFGVVPVLFILFNWITITYPSIICVTISIIYLTALLVFQGGNIKNELKKRMHL